MFEDTLQLAAEATISLFSLQFRGIPWFINRVLTPLAGLGQELPSCTGHPIQNGSGSEAGTDSVSETRRTEPFRRGNVLGHFSTSLNFTNELGRRSQSPLSPALANRRFQAYTHTHTHAPQSLSPMQYLEIFNNSLSLTCKTRPMLHILHGFRFGIFRSSQVMI